MYFKRLEKLKAFKVRSGELKKLDQFLANASAGRLHRFSPGLISQQQGMAVKRAAELLLMCSKLGITRTNYELECPNGDSDVVVHNLIEIPREQRQCRICFEEYTPNDKSIWLTFDLIAKVRLSKKKLDPEQLKEPQLSSKFSIENLSDNRYFQNRFVPDELYKIDMRSFQRQMKQLPTAESNDERKRALEDLSETVLCACSVFSVAARNKRTQTAELDRVFALSPPLGSFLRNWGEYVICECKNWDKPANSHVINHLSGNMKNANCSVAILFSKKGITGKNGRDAVGQIRNKFSLENQIIIVISQSDLEKVGAGENFLRLLEQKYFDLRFTP